MDIDLMFNYLIERQYEILHDIYNKKENNDWDRGKFEMIDELIKFIRKHNKTKSW